MEEVTHKDHILYDSIHKKCPEKANLQVEKRSMEAQSWGRQAGGLEDDG